MQHKVSMADVAAKALKARDWKGVVVRELLGPRDLSYSEATHILGERVRAQTSHRLGQADP